MSSTTLRACGRVPREQLQLAESEQLDVFDDIERAIVRYARKVPLSLEISDETWSALRRHLSKREAMEVAMAVAWYTPSLGRSCRSRSTEHWYERR